MLFDLILFLLLIVGIRFVCFLYFIPTMMNIDTRSIERYSHCLCLHVQPTSLIIGFIHLISSLLSIVLHFEDYSVYRDDEKRLAELHRSTANSLNMMVSLMMAIVSGLLIYGVTKSRPSYLMPFFGVKLYIFFFSLPASISMLCFSPHLSPGFDASRSWGGEMKRLWSSADPTTAYTSSVIMALIEFVYQLYFICVVWKCYRYLKLKETIIPLHIPYHLRGVEITVPSEIVTSPSAMSPPDYETATKLNPPPDYDSAIKNYQTAPNQVNINGMEPSITESLNTIRGGDRHNNHFVATDYYDNRLPRPGVNTLGSVDDNKGSEKCSDEKNSFSETTSSQPPPSTCHNESDSHHNLMNNSNDGSGGFGGTFNDNTSSKCDNSGSTNRNTTDAS